MKIILASGSKNRREIFKIAQIPVEIMPAHVDERSIKESDLPKRAIAIARLKADDVASKLEKQAVVIAGDGFNSCEGKILEKPKEVEEGKKMLRLLSDNLTIFYSGLVMVNLGTGEQFEEVAVTKTWFRKLGKAEIEDYVKS